MESQIINDLLANDTRPVFYMLKYLELSRVAK